MLLHSNGKEPIEWESLKIQTGLGLVSSKIYEKVEML